MTEPAVTEALDDFDVVNWLSDAVNASEKVTVYKDGGTLRALSDAAQTAREAAEQSTAANAAELSIADEYDEAAREAQELAEKLRDKLVTSGVTFTLRSIGTVARDALIETLKRDKRFKAVPAKDDVEAVPGGVDHPDFQDAFEEAMLSKSIVSAEANGKTDTRPWTPERVTSLRALPGNEFKRLWSKCFALHYMQYEIDQMIDLDFSSRH